MPEAVFLISYALLGTLSGVLAGLLGVGGGLVIVPVLLGLFSYQGLEPSVIAHAAIGSSLAAIIATAVSSSWAHHRHKAVDWKLFRWMAFGLFAGSLLGAWVASLFDTLMLKRIFGVFAILVSMQLFLGKQPLAEKSLPGFPGLSLVGSIIGCVSGVVGIGGGSMTVPYLTWHGISIRNAVATSAACGLPIAVAGFVGFLLTGWSSTSMPAYSSGYIYWPAVIGISIFSVLLAPVGARLAHQLPVKVLKRFFAVVLFIVGLKLIY